MPPLEPAYNCVADPLDIVTQSTPFASQFQGPVAKSCSSVNDNNLLDINDALSTTVPSGLLECISKVPFPNILEQRFTGDNPSGHDNYITSCASSGHCKEPYDEVLYTCQTGEKGHGKLIQVHSYKY